MKKYLKLTVLLLAVVFSSCNNDDSQSTEVIDQGLAMQDVSIILAPSNNNNSQLRVPVNRPLTVLPFVDMIEITANHVGAIDNTGYSVSESYEMIDDGSGQSEFVLKDVALGTNNFIATADTYRKKGEFNYGFVSGSTSADMNMLMGEMRAKAPHTTFYGEDDNVLVTEEGNNVVVFEMSASSGRLMTLIALDEKMISTFNSNYVVVVATYTDSDGKSTTMMKQFDATNYSEVLRFYWSHVGDTSTGATVEYEFRICDKFPNVTNTFSTSFDITTGESLGCMLIVNHDSVVENVNNFAFSFDWTELDCDPCDFDDNWNVEEDTSYYTEYVYGMCESPAGSFVNVTPYVYLTDYNTMYSRGIYIDGVRTDIIEMYNGSSDTISITFDYGNGEVLSISIEPGDMILWKAVSGQPLPTGQWTSSNGDVLTQWNTGYIPGDSICE
tara:strand:- start:167 stop:1489 length:1323 start_codon:yes stop_codon:yes gene_type:complete